MEYAIAVAVSLSVGFLLGAITESRQRKGRQEQSVWQEAALDAAWLSGRLEEREERLAKRRKKKARTPGEPVVGWAHVRFDSGTTLYNELIEAEKRGDL